MLKLTMRYAGPLAQMILFNASNQHRMLSSSALPTPTSYKTSKGSHLALSKDSVGKKGPQSGHLLLPSGIDRYCLSLMTTNPLIAYSKKEVSKKSCICSEMHKRCLEFYTYI